MISPLKQTIGLRMRPVEMNEIKYWGYEKVSAKFDGFGLKIDENEENEAKGRLDALTTKVRLRGEGQQRIFQLCYRLIILRLYRRGR